MISQRRGFYSNVARYVSLDLHYPFYFHGNLDPPPGCPALSSLLLLPMLANLSFQSFFYFYFRTVKACKGKASRPEVICWCIKKNNNIKKTLWASRYCCMRHMFSKLLIIIMKDCRKKKEEKVAGLLK